MRNALAKVTKSNAEMVAAAVRTIFAQPDAGAVAAQFDRITEMLQSQFPEVTTMLLDARDAGPGRPGESRVLAPTHAAVGHQEDLQFPPPDS